MRIDRLQVEEGFLDGLDVSFASGLNVIIGERGTGKTSLIELIRFCLDVHGYTPDSTKRSRDHALSILGSGQVTITLSEGDQQLLVTRTASDESPRSSGPFPYPIILSQTEIESVGLQAQGRLRLLDGFHTTQTQGTSAESQAASEVRSLTTEAASQRREIDELAAQVQEIPEIDKHIADLAPQERKLVSVSAAANDKKTQLDAIAAETASSTVRIDAIERFLDSVSRWKSSLASHITAPPALEPRRQDADPLANLSKSVERAKKHLDLADQELENALSQAQTLLRSEQDNRLETETRARQLRLEIDALQAGAGAIVRQGQQLRERKAQLESLKRVLADRRKRLKSIFKQRNAALDRLDSIRQGRFKARNNVARQLTETLGPRIRIVVSHAGQSEAFAAAVADALRGSGLRYNELSSTISRKLSPRELLDAVDSDDFFGVADTTNITIERAARALTHLRQCDLGSLATVTVDDSVALQFLDGTDYKDISDLSTGQRCTVILPLVLRHTDRVLIVDQPEDHIDNAFITDTLIVSILARTDDSQIIFSTHNANIPVLGNADRVVQLGSDGKRGFPLLNSTLYDADVIHAIMTVMEGGAEAFGKRASFYHHQADS